MSEKPCGGTAPHESHIWQEIRRPVEIRAEDSLEVFRYEELEFDNWVCPGIPIWYGGKMS